MAQLGGFGSEHVAELQSGTWLGCLVECLPVWRVFSQSHVAVGKRLEFFSGCRWESSVPPGRGFSKEELMIWQLTSYKENDEDETRRQTDRWTDSLGNDLPSPLPRSVGQTKPDTGWESAGQG